MRRVAACAALVALLGGSVLAQSRSAASFIDEARRHEAQGRDLQALNFYDRALEIEPRNPVALAAAGTNAMTRGDATLAFAYFAPWASMQPKNWRAQMAMGQSLAGRGQVREALAALERAHDLGAPAHDIAAHRGIAHDLAGDPKAAQRAYRDALKIVPGDRALQERLALSLAISGDLDGAMTLVRSFGAETDVDVRETSALVHALAGRAADATRIAGAGGTDEASRAAAMFFARLPTLGPRDKAIATHFGRLPLETYAELDVTPAPAAAVTPPAATAAVAPPPAAIVSTPLPASVRAASVVASPPVATAAAAPPPTSRAVIPSPAPPPVATAAATTPSASRSAPPAAIVATPVPAPVRAAPVAAPPPVATALVTAPAAARSAPSATIVATPVPVRAAPVAASPSPAGAPVSVPRAAPPPAPTGNIWVQLASSPDPAGLDHEWRRVRRAAGTLIDGYEPKRQTVGPASRLVVGPFDSARAAQALVDKLGARKVPALVNRPPPGASVQALD